MTQIIYIAILALGLWIGYIAEKKDRKAYIYFLILLLTFLAGFRGENCGVDTPSYYDNIVKGFPYPWMFREEGFRTMATFFMNRFKNPQLVFVSCAWKTYNFLKDNGFNAPLSFLKMDEVIDKITVGELSYPIVVKPRYGCGSISVAIAHDEEDLRYLTKKANEDIVSSYLKYESAATEEKVIYQECLKGQEYGADIINDLHGETQNVIVRKKLAMRSGETDIAQLVDEPIIKNTLLRLGNYTKHIANMDCDVFLVDGVPYVLEMNARFGGGYPFSHMGGCNLPKAIVDWVKGKIVDKSVISAMTGITGYKEIYITRV